MKLNDVMMIAVGAAIGYMTVRLIETMMAKGKPVHCSMKRFVFHVRVAPPDTRKAVALLRGSTGVNALAGFAGWCHATPLCGSGTEIVRHVTIEDSSPATGAITASVTVDGVDATQAMTRLASLLQGALQQGGVSGTVSYGYQDYNAHYATMTPISDAVTRIPETLKDMGQNAQIRWRETLQFVSQGATQALIVTAVGAILFLAVAEAITE